MMWQCPKCGLDNPEDSSICGNCGYNKSQSKRKVPLTIAIIATAIVVMAGALAWATQSVRHQHNWGEWTEVSAAKCESTGKQIRICKSNSSHVEERETPALGHDWGEWTVETDATCEAAGVEVRYCKNDADHQERREIPALGHDWQPATNSRPETCSRCGKQQGEALQPAPGPSDMAGHNNIKAPQNSSWLPARETRYVCARGGVAAMLFPEALIEPKTDRKIADILDGTELTILAFENNHYLVKLSDGRLGWMGMSQVGETNLLSTVPQLAGSYWVYTKGAGEANTFACKFESASKIIGFRLSDGKQMTWDCRLSARRLTIDGMKLIWDGEQFAYGTQAYLRADTDQSFENYS